MQHAKKMALVDPRLLEALQQRQQPSAHMQDPTTKTLSSLDGEMNAALQEPGGDEYKIAKYNQILQRYLTYQDKRKNTPFKVQLTGEKKSITVDDDDNHDDDNVTKEVVESVPKSMERRAKVLMKRLKRSNEVSWNERGELILNGKSLPGSNVADLVNDILRKRKTVRPPVGWQAFAKQLRTMNVPREVVGNPTRWSFMTNIGGGHPPGVPEDDDADAAAAADYDDDDDEEDRPDKASPVGGPPRGTHRARARRRPTGRGDARATLGLYRVHKWTPY